MSSARNRLAYLVTIFFVANIAVPRATFYSHTHKGGEAAHVHLADDPGAASGDPALDRAIAEALGTSFHPHHHHHHPPGDRPALEEPDDIVGSAHWHAQSPFQPTLRIAPPELAAPIRITTAIPFEPEQSESVGVRRTRARSPPTL